MSTEQNKELATRMIEEIFNRGNIGKADEFMGFPPTGKSVSVGVIDIIRIADGKFAEHWGQMDSMAMMQQLGAIGAPGQG